MVESSGTERRKRQVGERDSGAGSWFRLAREEANVKGMGLWETKRPVENFLKAN